MAATPQNQNLDGMSPQERMAREYLAQGRFRKARDEFKVLCKADRPKFLPLLIEANVGLMREMQAKGMKGEAAQLLVYLKTIVPPAQHRILELEMTAGPVNQGATEDALGAIFSPALGEPEKQRMVDRLVLGFEPVSNSRPEHVSLAGEIGAVIAGLRAISAGQFDQALDLVRPIGQSSLLTQWKIFIKGLAAFHGGDWDKAKRFLTELAPASGAGRAAQGYLLLMGVIPVTGDSPLPSETVVETASRVLGEKGCAGVLLRAEQAWRKGDACKAYQVLRSTLGGFPALSTGLMGSLSQFAINCIFSLPDKPKCGLIDFLGPMIAGHRAKSPVEDLLTLRVMILDAHGDMSHDTLLEQMDRLLEVHAKLHGPDPKLESLAYGWLGTMLSRESGTLAVELLERAARLDPENLDASLKLCEVYENLKLKSDRNRFLDKLTDQFPNDKNVLLLAARACLDRKTYKRGLDYVEHALAQDRLDPAIPDLLARGRMLQAHDFVKKRRPDDARKAMEQAAAVAVETQGNLDRSRWCLKVQQGLIESALGDSGRSKKAMWEAKQASPSLLVFLYYAGTAADDFGMSIQEIYEFFEEIQLLISRNIDSADVVWMTRIWSRAKELEMPHALTDSRCLMNDAMARLAKKGAARGDAAKLVEFSFAEDEFAESAQDLIDSQLKIDSLDPLFRLYRLRGELMGRDARNQDRAELESIIAEATARKEEQTVRQARQRLDSLKTPPPGYEEAGKFDELPDEFVDDDKSEDDSFPFPGGGLPGISPEQQRTMEELIETIANASKEELAQMRKSRPMGMPPEIFDILVAAARAKGFHPKKRRGGSDPNQSEFF